MSLVLQSFEDGNVPVHNRILIWGDSGVGKTYAACRATADLDLDLQEVFDGRAVPKGDSSIFYLGLEQNGLQAARTINPKARFRFVSLLDSDGTPNPKRALSEVVEVIRWAASGQLQEAGIRTLVVDGLTELQRLEKDAIVDGLDDRARENWFSQDDWNFLNEKSRRMLNTLRAIEIELVCTALEDSYEAKLSGAQTISPKFEGKRIPAEVLAFFSAAARMQKVIVPGHGGSETIEYRAMFEGPARYRVKACGAVGGWQKPCAAAWLDVLAGKIPAAATRIRDGASGADPDRSSVVATPAPEEKKGTSTARSARR